MFQVVSAMIDKIYTCVPKKSSYIIYFLVGGFNPVEKY